MKILVDVKDKKQLSKIKAALKLIDVNYQEIEVEKETDIYYPELQKKIDQSRLDKEEGRLIKYDPNTLWST